MPVLQPKRKQSASAKRCGFISIFFHKFALSDLKIVCAVDANIHRGKLFFCQNFLFLPFSLFLPRFLVLSSKKHLFLVFRIFAYFIPSSRGLMAKIFTLDINF